MSVRAYDERISAWISKRPSQLTDIERAWLRHIVHGAAFDPSDFDDDGKRNGADPKDSTASGRSGGTV